MFRNLKWVTILSAAALVGCSGGNDKPQPAPANQSSTTQSAAPQPPAIFRFHFVGTTRLASDTNAAPWASMGEAPSFQALRQQTIGKLARAPRTFIGSTASTDDFAKIFEEILADLIASESFTAAAGNTNDLTEFAVAVRLPAARADYWNSNLKSVIEAWTGQRPESSGSAAWQIKDQAKTGNWRLARERDWTVVSWAKAQSALSDSYLQGIKQTGTPAPVKQGLWAEAYVDSSKISVAQFPILSAVLSAVGLSQQGLPEISLQFDSKGQNLQIKGDAVFRDTLSPKLENWNIPTNLIHQPMIGFTAARGIAPAWKNMEQSLGLPAITTPNQMIAWNGGLYPVQFMVTVPTTHGEDFIRSSAGPLADRFNQPLKDAEAGYVTWATNLAGGVAVRWMGIPPWITPMITAVTNAPSGDRADFLLACMYPNWEGEAPAPVLYDYLNSKTNLIYYDWEITSERFQAWRATINIFSHFFEKTRVPGEAVSIGWMNSISNRMAANTVTEISRTSSNRLGLIRQGPIGLNGIEMVALSHWLESPDFPRMTSREKSGTNAPAAPPSP